MDQYLYFISFLLVSLIILKLVWRYCEKAIRIPYSVYCGLYLITTVIGATLFAIVGPEVLLLGDMSINISVLHAADVQYWIILYAPLMLPGLLIVMFNRRNLNNEQFGCVLNEFPQNVDYIAYVYVLIFLSGYCLLDIYNNGLMSNLSFYFADKGDYADFMEMRFRTFDRIGSTSLGFIYMALPTLSHVALYAALAKKEIAWRALFIVTFLITCFLSLTTMEKSILIVYIMSLAIGLVLLEKIKVMHLVILGAGYFMLLTLWQSYIVDDWNYLLTIAHVVFRMGSNFPFYMQLYPETEPFTGVDLMSILTGLSSYEHSESKIVSAAMNPDTWFEGNATAPAHAVAYVEGGVYYSLLTVAAIGICIMLIASLKKYINGPLVYALYISCILYLYYLTQVSVQGALWQCYGIKWSLLPIASLIICTKIIQINPANKLREI